MKTAISMPDETFRRVDERAAVLGVSRSEFFATAAARYLDELDRASLTGRIDEALATEGTGAVRDDRAAARRSTAALARALEDDPW